MKRKGPDSLQSWIIVGACCFINMMMLGMGRLSGVLFVSSMSRFNVGRKAASFPYTFCTFIRNILSPLVGYLGHKFGVRAVTSVGCFLAAAGIAICYTAENIQTVSILWGVVFGIGYGFGSILLPVSINQYFDKHRATASGISFSGACLGSFVLPPIVELLLNTYGLSGTFLFLAGFVLNCVPAALLLKKPDFEIDSSNGKEKTTSDETQRIINGKKVKLYTIENSYKSASLFNSKRLSEPIMGTKRTRNALERADSNLPKRTASLTYDEQKKRLPTLPSDHSTHINTSEPIKVVRTINNSKETHVDFAQLEGETKSVMSQLTDNSGKNDVFVKEDSKLAFEGTANDKERPGIGLGFYQKCRALSAESVLVVCRNEGEFHHTKSFNGAYSNLAYNGETADDLGVHMTSANVNHKSSTLTRIAESNKSSALEIFSIFWDPIFILIIITHAIYTFSFVCMMTVIVDYARDINIGTSNEKYILMSFSVADFVGRLSLGSITDKGYMTKSHFTTLCFCSQGIATAAVAWSSGFAVLVATVVFYGFSQAGLILIFPLLTAEFIEKEKHTVAISSGSFLSGPVCLAVAPLIGFFRGEIGSYEYIFYGITLLSLLSGISWMFAPYVARCRKASRT